MYSTKQDLAIHFLCNNCG